MSPGAVLVTRPEPAAQETAARLKALGHRVLIAPFLLTQRLPAHLPARAAACVITSANAVWALPPDVPVFAVGDATAARARAITNAPVFSAAADAAALSALVAQKCDPTQGPLLLLSGHRQGTALATDLRAHGFKLIRRAVYRAVPPPAFPEAAATAIADGAIHTALFFSPETARAFTRLCPKKLWPALGQISALTLSPAISRALAPLPWREIANAAHPSQEALLELLGQ